MGHTGRRATTVTSTIAPPPVSGLTATRARGVGEIETCMAQIEHEIDATAALVHDVQAMEARSQ